MSIKNKKARQAYWASLSPEIKSAKMSDIAKKRQAKMTEIQKKKLGKFLANTRKKARELRNSSYVKKNK